MHHLDHALSAINAIKYSGADKQLEPLASDMVDFVAEVAAKGLAESLARSVINMKFA